MYVCNCVDCRGHTSFVLSCVFTKEGNVLSGSADGSVKLWDGRSADCLMTYRYIQ